MAKILIVEDEPSMRDVLCTLLRGQGHEVIPASAGGEAIELMPQVNPDLIISDIKMSPVNGMEVLRAAKQYDPGIGVIMVTAYETVEGAVEAMKMGAHDYVSKPFKIDELQIRVEHALSYERDKKKIQILERVVKEKYRFDNIIGSGSEMQQVFQMMERVAAIDSTVLILGESGTGKELVAKALHYNSRRRDKAFVAINCSALPEALFESELFGHRKGSFTGATEDKKGLFQEADGGTIFLDEIGWMAASLQAKLLRVLQERELRRVGDTQSLKVDVRVLAATNQPLQKRMEEGTFREDLYYRISVIPIELPPLRDRTEDIPELVRHFLAHRRSSTNEVPKISDEAMELLLNHPWPGNVRELENAIERGVALCDHNRIEAKDLPPRIIEAVKKSEIKHHFVPRLLKPAPETPDTEPVAEAVASAAQPVEVSIPAAAVRVPVGTPAPAAGAVRSLDEFSKEQESAHIDSVLDTAGGDKKEAARLLGISLATLYRKLLEQPASA